MQAKQQLLGRSASRAPEPAASDRRQRLDIAHLATFGGAVARQMALRVMRLAIGRARPRRRRAADTGNPILDRKGAGPFPGRAAGPAAHTGAFFRYEHRNFPLANTRNDAYMLATMLSMEFANMP